MLRKRRLRPGCGDSRHLARPTLWAHRAFGDGLAALWARRAAVQLGLGGVLGAELRSGFAGNGR